MRLAASGPACFNVAMIQGHDPVGAHTVRFDLGPGTAYEVDFSGPQCDTIDWTHRIMVQSTASSWICSGNEAGQGNIIFHDTVVPQDTTCYIDTVRAVSGS